MSSAYVFLGERADLRALGRKDGDGKQMSNDDDYYYYYCHCFFGVLIRTIRIS